MIRKQNILATLMIFLNQQKAYMKNFDAIVKTATSELFINIANRKKNLK